ncbi:phosphoserine phosphatase SerB [Mangrovicoccus algicola]|uniref:Phosphoserine phosphatase n=1 Tax=Mangrovicoccus algicola TaxID=2771008 RepID=A0A8J6Z833_9RHOB|nr:phosphoserine phosphatase SerB [Mangrovicoccus algicola]MBE3639669.1 phosphoserine phosphatase SerB [Mangrovicoccus algicola]
MFTVTLLSNPAAPCLEASAAEALASAWEGGALRWLAPGEAAEFDLATRPADLWTRWAALQGQGIDLALQPSANRRRRMLLADMDSTMIAQECIDELADMAGVGARVKDITARAMNGELDFEGALTERVALLKGLPESVIAEVYDARITMAPGGKVLIATMKAHGGHAALVSGGFTAFTERVAAELGFDEHRANTLLSQDGVLTGEVARPILGREAKIEALEQISARLGLTPADVLAVGDGANDLGMIHAAGTGVALHAKPAVAAESDLRVNHGDLTALLYLQGYARAEFVA